MSAVTSQPLPLGGLEREKHIQMIFRAFQNRCECQTHSPGPKPRRTAPDWDSDEQLSVGAPERKMANGSTQPPEGMNRLGIEEQSLGGAAGSDFMSVLETKGLLQCRYFSTWSEQSFVVAGPQCVPRRIYSITTHGSRSQLFVAVEARACTLKGFDCEGCQLFYFERPFRADACCLGCCLMEMKVYTPQKHLIGTVCQRWSMFTPLLEVCDSEGESTIRIQGTCCPSRCFSNQQFQIVSNIGEKIGTIWKRWPGFNDEGNMDHEYFGLDVPMSLESHIKLLLLATTFLLNHMFFEMS
ncbi:unnamed protein product [Pleuronectes platessa]|uniref:Phospholipid scramblase n=1 Tax=Pleuronectes platessa TaxID=8262 RepID=A0A9N7V2T7_PLEPL|nr:unnamed protein product [Pleuronectes platessa]